MCWKRQIILFKRLWETRDILHPINKKKYQVKFPKNMLSSLKIHNKFVYGVYTEDKADIICQIHHLHLEQYFIQQQHDLNFQYLC